MRATHLAAGIFLGLVSVFCLVWLIPNHTTKAMSELDLNPSFMPNVAMVTCLIMAVILAIKAWRMPKVSTNEMHDEFGEEATGGSVDMFRNLGLWFVTATATLFLMDWVGFEIAMTLFLAIGLYYLGARNWVLMAVIALFAPLLLTLGTWYLLGVQLPGFINEMMMVIDPIVESLFGGSE